MNGKPQYVRLWTAAEVSQVANRLNQAIAMPTVMPAPTKYGNTKVWWQGQKFDSKRQCQTFKNLEFQRIAGHLRAVVRQVSFQLPGTKRRIRIDFMLVENDGRIRWLDAKGVETEAWANKREQCKSAFGIEIELI